MSKINLELGGKYTAGEMFKRANEDLKAFGKNTKDIGDLGRTGLKLITDHVDGPLKSALNGMSTMLSGLVSGGIFGLIAGAATAAFGYISEKMKEAKEAAKALGDYLSTQFVESLKGVQDDVKGLSEYSAEATKDMEKLIKTSKDGIQSDAKFKVQQLHVETLQKITDQMSDAAKKVVEADEAYQAGMIKARAEYQQAQTEFGEVVKRQVAIKEEIIEAEGNVKAAEQQIYDVHGKYYRVLEKRTELTELANSTTEQLMEKGMSYSEAVEARTKAVHDLNELEENNKPALEAVRVAEEGLAQANEALSNLRTEQSDLGQRSKIVSQNLNTAQEALTATELELSQKKMEANKLLEIENAQARAKIEKEESSEALRVEQMRWTQHVIDETKKANITEEEWNELMKVVNQGLEDGLEDMEMEHSLRKKWLELMEKRNKNQEKENKDAETGKKNENPASASASMTVKLDESSGDEIGEATEKKLDFNDWMKKVREEQRKVRDAKNNMKIDQAKMTKALKGEMPEAEAKEWIKYAKSKYTPEQMKELANYARKGELMSPKSKEWQAQNERFKNMLKLMQDDDKKKSERDENSKKTAENTEQMKKDLEKTLAIK